MRVVDWCVLVAFLVWIVADGLRRARGTQSLEGYYAGSRSIPWWAAGLSVMATQASAITVIGTTGQGHEGGMEFVQLYFGLAFAMVLLCIFIVPLYRALPILTAYEFLEGRFGPATRTLASAIFLISRGLALAIVLYAPAVVLSAMTGLDLTVTILIIGALTTLYTMFGGVSAVIWTDVKQMSVIIGGLLLCLGILLYDILTEISFGDALAALGASGKLNALELQPASLEFLPRPAGATTGTRSFWEDSYNFWSGLFGGLFLHLAYFGADQSQVQRILTNPSIAQSRQALLLSAFAKVPMQAGVLFIGVLMYLFLLLNPSPLLFNPADVAAAADNPQVQAIEQRYVSARAEQRRLLLEMVAAPGGPRTSPVLGAYQDKLRESSQLRSQARKLLHDGEDAKDTNYIFVRFILDNVPAVFLGLIIAAIFAAAMSSADSAFNSLSAATVVDFYRRWLRPQASEREFLLAGRCTTALWGLSATLAALMFEGAGSVIELINKVGSWFYGSLLGVFVLALVCRRAGPWAGALGLLGGMATVLAVNQCWQIAYLWYNVVGCVGVLVVGVSVSFFERPRAASAARS